MSKSAIEHIGPNRSADPTHNDEDATRFFVVVIDLAISLRMICGCHFASNS